MRLYKVNLNENRISSMFNFIFAENQGFLEELLNQLESLFRSLNFCALVQNFDPCNENIFVLQFFVTFLALYRLQKLIIIFKQLIAVLSVSLLHHQFGLQHHKRVEHELHLVSFFVFFIKQLIFKFLLDIVHFLIIVLNEIIPCNAQLNFCLDQFILFLVL
jgi:hypothetical protein